ncbi:MAG: hypothetical protein M1813_008811 [Trichoglossum hirsutum]|nr:MAG: hypothetical protein M1813_008811 [Trichoglossum hirsutum]
MTSSRHPRDHGRNPITPQSIPLHNLSRPPVSGNITEGQLRRVPLAGCNVRNSSRRQGLLAGRGVAETTYEGLAEDSSNLEIRHGENPSSYQLSDQGDDDRYLGDSGRGRDDEVSPPADIGIMPLTGPTTVDLQLTSRATTGAPRDGTNFRRAKVGTLGGGLAEARPGDHPPGMEAGLGNSPCIQRPGSEIVERSTMRRRPLDKLAQPMGPFTGLPRGPRGHPPKPLEGNTLGIFSPNNRIRLKLCDVLLHP